ncbi:hypothetical protein LZ30DRAFT_808272 [Colletotrichum cereale]|nr:hypothetical protein LZ30DRAFT_808272 [Colletotrichum cereale]
MTFETSCGSDIKSSNFMTCLQVQYLFVGGYFNLWYNSRDKLQLNSLVRAFPRWFVKKHHCGARIQKEYHAAIGEWSPYLSTQSTYAGKFRGQIERCLWGCSGESNFLHKVPSTIKSFILENVGVEAPARTVKFYDRVSPDGSEIDFFKLTVKGAESLLVVERWALNRRRSPKLKATQRIVLSEECLRLYEHGLRRGVAEKASILDVTRDGKVLRVGSSSGSSRSSAGSDESTHNDSNSEDARSTMETSENQPAVWGSRERTAIPSSNEDSLEVRSEFSDKHGYDALDWSDNSSMASNSARESWSEGSTPAKSDEIGEDRILENFDDDSRLSFKEDGISESGLFESSSGDHDIRLENMSFQHSSLSSAKSLNTFVDRSSDDHSSSESEQQAPFSMDDSAYDHSSSDQSGDDGEGTQAAIARLENLLEIRRKKQEGASCEVQIYRLSKENDLPQTKVFSFRTRSQTRLYASPPTFHPTSDLLVWPLGDNEILFANFTENAYFIRAGIKHNHKAARFQYSAISLIVGSTSIWRHSRESRCDTLTAKSDLASSFSSLPTDFR